MMRLRGSRRLAKRKPETSLRLEIAPGIAAAHAGHTVIILEAINGAQVRVRDVATGAERAKLGLVSNGASYAIGLLMIHNKIVTSLIVEANRETVSNRRPLLPDPDQQETPQAWRHPSQRFLFSLPMSTHRCLARQS
jgi:hypothetical protein